jgi:hypothetical protein
MKYGRLYGYILPCWDCELELQLKNTQTERVVWSRRYKPADGDWAAACFRDANRIEKTYNETVESIERMGKDAPSWAMFNTYSMTYKGKEHIVKALSMRAGLILEFPWMKWDEWPEVTIRVLEIGFKGETEESPI